MENKFKSLSEVELYETNGGIAITKAVIGLILIGGGVGVMKGCTDAMDSDKCGC